jgi:hypothetical protein
MPIETNPTIEAQTRMSPLRHTSSYHDPRNGGYGAALAAQPSSPARPSEYMETSPSPMNHKIGQGQDLDVGELRLPTTQALEPIWVDVPVKTKRMSQGYVSRSPIFSAQRRPG